MWGSILYENLVLYCFYPSITTSFTKGLQKLFMVCFLYSQIKFRKVNFFLVAVVMKDPDHDVITCFLLCSVGTLSSFSHEITNKNYEIKITIKKSPWGIRLRNRDNQAMKFDQLTKHKARNLFFFKNHLENYAGRLD